MKEDVKLKEAMKRVVSLLETEGVDFQQDQAFINMVFPQEHPGVLVTITIGSIFDSEEEEEVLH
jgi:hypothetical protein